MLGSRQRDSEVDEVVPDDTEPDPALHSRVAMVAAAVEPVAPLQKADSPFATGPPFLAVLEPSLLLLLFPLRALGGVIGHGHAFDVHGQGGRLRRGRVISGVGRREARHSPQPLVMHRNRQTN